MQPGLRPAVTFEEVAVYFSPAEWAELAPWQRALHREVMGDNYDLVASLDPDSKFTHVKEGSHGEFPVLGGIAEFPTPLALVPEAVLPARTAPGDAGTWSAVPPRSGWRDTEPGGCARTLPREVPARSGLLISGNRGLSFGAEAALRAHLDEPPGPPYLCGTCGKSFRHRRGLLTHKKLRRGAWARHGCAECGRAFCLRGDLLRHRDAHRARPRRHRRFPGAAGPCEERPFVCGRCGRGFSWRESLELHLRGHRAPGSAQPCPGCGRSTARRGHRRPVPRAPGAAPGAHRTARPPRSQRQPRGHGHPPGDGGPRGDGDPLRDRDRDTDPRGDGDSLRDGDRDTDPRGDGDSLRDRDLLKDRHPREDGDLLGDRGLPGDGEPLGHRDLFRDREPLGHKELLRDGRPLGDRDHPVGDQQ